MLQVCLFSLLSLSAMSEIRTPCDCHNLVQPVQEEGEELQTSKVYV